METKENNEFSGKKLLEPRAKVNPQIYENTALYVGLYQSIFGSYSDYGFNDRATLDVFINAKIKTMVQVIDKILKANPDCPLKKLENLKESDFTSGALNMPPLSNSGPHYANETVAFKQVIDNNWIGNYFPLIAKDKKFYDVDPLTGRRTERVEKVLDSGKYNENPNGTRTYATEFLKNFDRSVAIAQDLTSKIGNRSDSGNMLTVSDARHMLKAEQTQLSELFNGYRSASEGQPFKYDTEGKKYKSGEYYEAYRGAGSNSALNRMKEKKFFIRREWGKLALKVLGLAAFGTATVFSAGALLSFGGIAMSSVFGTIFANMGVGSAVSAGIGTLFGGIISSRLATSIAGSFGALYSRYKDRRHFLEGVGKYAPKDGKPQGFKKLREQYYTALGLKDYFINNGNMKKLDRRSRKYVRKYLKENPGLEKQKIYYNFVDSQSGTFQLLYRKLNNVVQAVPEQDKGRKMFASEATSYVRKALEGGETDFGKLIKASQVLEDYKEKIGDVNTNAFRAGMSEAYVKAFMENIYNLPFTSDTQKLKERLSVPEIKDTLEKYSATGTDKKQIEASLAFMDTIKTPKRGYQSEFKLRTDLGVGIEQQVNINKDTMQGACVSLCPDLTDPEKNAVKAIATNIQNMTEREPASVTAIQNAITGLTRTPASPEFDKVKTYLDSMLKKRVETSKYSAAQVENTIETARDASGNPVPVTPSNRAKIATISSLINGLKRDSNGEFKSGNKSISEIRAEIMADSTDYTQSHKTAALDLLEKQVKAIENREFSDTEAAMVSVMHKGNFNKLTELIKYVNELSFDKIGGAEFNTWYDANVKNNSRRPFLDVHIKTRVEELIFAEAESDKYKKQDAATLDEIVKLIQVIKGCVRLDDAQRTRLINSLAPKIEKAVSIKLDSIKLDFASNYDSNELKKLTNSKNGLLRDFFALETLESQDIKNRILQLANLSDLKKMITANIKGVGSDLTEDIREANAFSAVYMFNGAGALRDNRDELYKHIGEMSDIARNTDVDSLKVSARTNTGGTWGSRVIPAFASDMNRKLNEILSMTDERDRYAALIVLKKRCLAMFKAHVNAYHSKVIQPTGMDAQTYFNHPNQKENYLRQVYDGWVFTDTANPNNNGILNKIDDALRAVTAMLGARPKLQDEEYFFVSAVESAEKSYGLTTAAQYRSSPQM